MHEAGLVRDLVRKADAVVTAEDADRATSITVRIGALSHLSAEHLRSHFDSASRDTALEGADLVVEIDEDPSAADAMVLVLVAVEVRSPSRP